MVFNKNELNDDAEHTELDVRYAHDFMYDTDSGHREMKTLGLTDEVWEVLSTPENQEIKAAHMGYIKHCKDFLMRMKREFQMKAALQIILCIAVLQASEMQEPFGACTLA